MNMKKSQKIILSITVIIVITLIVAGAYWFSMPSEERNMIKFMMLDSSSYDNYQEYEVIARNELSLAPTAFEPLAAQTSDDNYNVNVVSITEMVQNENSKMFKKGMMRTTGVDNYTGWHVIADEGAEEGENPFGPSPLSYYTAGIASNLHTQILRAAEVKDVVLDNVKVEVLNTFRWDDMMSKNGAGYLDETYTNIIIESDSPEELIQEIKEMAINSWTAGEALREKTVIEPNLVVNGDNWEYYHASPGTTAGVESYDSDFILSSVTDVPQEPEFLELVSEEDVAEDFGMESMSNLEFEIFAISESGDNSERPYLKKVTISTPSSETWEIYSDEFMSATDKPLAPTSLEYFTVGTSLCLTSQTTLMSAMLDLDYTDYRVESQMDYRVENVNSESMVSYTDTVHSFVILESEDSQEKIDRFYNQALSLCFAGEGLKGATDMHTTFYLNGKKVK